MRYEGYQENLPIHNGQTVVIPAGVTVKSTHPKHKTFVSKKTRAVRVDHVLPGQSIPNHEISGDTRVRTFLEAKGVNLSHVEHFRRTNDIRFYRGFTAVENPKVVWAGSGGYWCEVDVNDILAANGLEG